METFQELVDEIYNQVTVSIQVGIMGDADSIIHAGVTSRAVCYRAWRCRCPQQAKHRVLHYFPSWYDHPSPYAQTLMSELIGGIQSVAIRTGKFSFGELPFLATLGMMTLTPNQITGLLNHGDSPYIRAIGMLYLRYVCDPSSLLQWFWDYLNDDEPIQLHHGGKVRGSANSLVCPT